jgi:peroxin-5
MPTGLEAAFQRAAESGDMSALEEIWKQSLGEQKLEDFWDQAAKADSWKMAGLEEDADLMHQALAGEEGPATESWMDKLWRAGKKDEYQFQTDNPYRDLMDPLAEALRLVAEGRDRDAMLCLEAEVTKNPESSEGWRMLGQLYAEMDQDVEAIQCLRKGHEVDPYNLDSLLALGVSCTNELDQLPALRYMREWISNHEDHQLLVRGLDPPADYEYEAWRTQVTSLFKQATRASPSDADVFVALGVMENINRNYEEAVKALATACRLRPHDHTCWNKLGATLANSGRSEQAVIAYHQGLQLKPNYARSWSNLAIAHANLQQHGDAARFYLSSLVLNPNATHIWSFLHNAVLNMAMWTASKRSKKRTLGR